MHGGVMLRVALFDDEEIVVRGLAAMLRRYAETVEVVDSSGFGTECVDIALYDTFAMKTGRGHHLERLLCDPRIGKVVVFTWNFQPWLARETMEQGVSGYLSKSLTGHQLVEALQAVASGRIIVCPAPRGNRLVDGDWPGREEGLTAREAEVLSLITMGLSNLEIAERMSLSVNSIKSYIRSCYRRIDVDSRSKAVLWGVAHGIRVLPHNESRPALLMR
jgi:DNA-binding NarL/FixJ family response regulator